MGETTMRVAPDMTRGVAAFAFGDDAIVRTDGPTTLRSGGIDPSAAALGAACTSGCKTKDHRSYAECLQSKRVRVAYCDSASGSDATAQKKWDHELDLYRQVRREGIQPDSTNLPQIREAMALSDAAGAAYGRDFSKAEPWEG